MAQLAHAFMQHITLCPGIGRAFAERVDTMLQIQALVQP